MSGKLKAKEVLDIRTRQISASAMLLAEQTSDWQMVQAYVAGRLQNLELTPTQEEKLGRYQFVYNQLVTGKYSDGEVCEMLDSTYGLSYVQALQDIRDAKEVFGCSISLNKQYELKLELQLNQQYTQMAMAAGDFRAAAQFGKTRAKLIEMIADEVDTSPEDFTGHTNVFVFDPRLLGQQLDMKQAEELLRDLEAKFPGKIDLTMRDIEDAVIVEDDGGEA